jgi:hypothetical protein
LEEEETVVAIRKELEETGVLGEYGGEAIPRETIRRGCDEIPTPRTRMA